MAVMTVTTTSKLAYASKHGTAGRPDQVSLRLTDQSGTVYLRKTSLDPLTANGPAANYAGVLPASSSTSFFIKDAEVYAVDLIAGEAITVITASGTEEIRITGEPGGIFGA